jgi:hypothetical protein
MLPLESRRGYAPGKRFDVIVPGVDVAAVPFARLRRRDAEAPRGGLTALLRMALPGGGSGGSSAAGDNYAGTIHGVDLYGDPRTFAHRAWERACKAKTPIAMMSPQYADQLSKTQTPLQKKQRTNVVPEACCMMTAVLNALCAVTDIDRRDRWRFAAAPPMPPPLEIADGMCASFRPRPAPADGRSPEAEWLAA